MYIQKEVCKITNTCCYSSHCYQMHQNLDKLDKIPATGPIAKLLPTSTEFLRNQLIEKTAQERNWKIQNSLGFRQEPQHCNLCDRPGTAPLHYISILKPVHSYFSLL